VEVPTWIIIWQLNKNSINLRMGKSNSSFQSMLRILKVGETEGKINVIINVYQYLPQGTIP